MVKSNSKNLDKVHSQDQATSKLQRESRRENPELIKELKREICSLNYEECLKALDLILEELQNENVPLEHMHKYYLKGKVCIEHCETLLDITEQEILELDSDSLEPKGEL